MSIMTIFHEMQFRLGGSHIFDPRRASRSTPNRLKTGLRRVQERQKNDAFVVLIFDSFWGRLGVFFGVVLGSKIDPKIFHRFMLDGLDFDLVIGWSQDGSKTVPRGLLGRSWALFGGSWGAFEPS